MLRKTGFALALLSLVVAAPAVALARTAPRPARPVVVHHIYDGDEIEGALVGPDGEWIKAKKTTELPSLLPKRQSFVAEMIGLELDL